MVRHLVATDCLRDLVRHPAFAGFARLLLPWDDRPYDEDMPLRELGSLLPFHSHVEPRVVLGALNRMIDAVNEGETIFYDFYTREQKARDFSRANTGLFFIRGKSGAPFAIVSPGGGFSYVGALHEGFPYATAIQDAAYNAFVLRYRAGHGGEVATQDLAVAISCVFERARTLGVSTDGYSLWGSSAGARMAAAIGSHGVASCGGSDVPRPSTVVMAYTAHSDYSADDPPTFVVVGERDTTAPPSTMERRVMALRKLGIAVEFHRYPRLGHGFGVGAGTSAEGWISDAIRFWAERTARACGF